MTLIDRISAILVGIGVGLVICISIMAGALLSTLAGALTGAIVGLFFSDTILSICAQLGVYGVEVWQVGAFLGFVGGFFKAPVTIKTIKGDRS